MRLHTMQVTAFGPFATTQHVDFDALGEAGLFLLSGPTGSGKTSVLDAVCFALYGRVPGARDGAGQLRCQHAGPEVAPRVVLELSLGPRRFRFTRSPAWLRPKRRGVGTTQEKPHVLVEELLDSAWSTCTTRVDEAQHLVDDLLGMNLGQFCQVALLPQGEFQAFLRASSKTRQEILQKLFHTRRYEDIEAWLADHRRLLGQRAQEHERAVRALVDRTAEVHGVAVPEEFDEADPLTAGVLAWAREAYAAARSELAEADARRTRQRSLSESAQARAQRAAHAEALRVRARETRVEQSRLDAEAPAHRERRDRIAAARAARPVTALATAEQDSARRLAKATERLETRHTQLCALGVLERPAQEALPFGSPVDPDELAEALATAQTLDHDLRQASSAQQRVQRLRAEHEERDDRLAGIEEQTRDLAERLAALPGRQETLEAARDRAREAVGASTDLDRELAGLDEVRTAALAAEQLVPQIEEAQQRTLQATSAHQDARQHLLDLREQRIQGMAAELATSLAVGADCPVCGSHDHPQPARAGSVRVTEDEERTAQRAVDDAASALQVVEQHARELTLRRESLLARSDGKESAAVEREIAEATGRRTELAREADALEQHETALTELAQDRERWVAARESLRTLRESLTTRGDEAARECAELAAEVQEVAQRAAAFLPGLHDACPGSTGDAPDQPDTSHSAHPTGSADPINTDELHLLQRHVGSVRDDLGATRDLLAEARTHREELERLTEAVRVEVRTAGFADVRQARDAALEPAALDALVRAADAYESAVTRVDALAEDPELQAVWCAPAEDLGGLRDAAEQAAAELLGTEQTTHRLETTTARAAGLCTELAEALDAWEPSRAAYRTASELSAFVGGRAADNLWRMRLSAYVLAHRLGQVVAAANARLTGMSQGRYLLEHTGERGAGETRGGLSLRVLDGWTGEPRDPATLSGGETFVVSLALALGLADVVGSESGGRQLGTLFVDEGFGSLDADSLDDVMETLESLRSGGRVVGIVSHVPELKDQIAARLEVQKSREGSRLRMVQSVG